MFWRTSDRSLLPLMKCCLVQIRLLGRSQFKPDERSRRGVQERLLGRVVNRDDKVENKTNWRHAFRLGWGRVGGIQKELQTKSINQINQPNQSNQIKSRLHTKVLSATSVTCIDDKDVQWSCPASMESSLGLFFFGIYGIFLPQLDSSNIFVPS